MSYDPILWVTTRPDPSLKSRECRERGLVEGRRGLVSGVNHRIVRRNLSPFLSFFFSSLPSQDARLHSCNLQRAFKGTTTCPICDEPRLPLLVSLAPAFVVISEARRRTLRAGRELVNEQLFVPIALTLLRRDELARIIQFRVAPSSRRRIIVAPTKNKELPFVGARPLFRLPLGERGKENERGKEG